MIPVGSFLSTILRMGRMGPCFRVAFFCLWRLSTTKKSKSRTPRLHVTQGPLEFNRTLLSEGAGPSLAGRARRCICVCVVHAEGGSESFAGKDQVFDLVSFDCKPNAARWPAAVA